MSKFKEHYFTFLRENEHFFAFLESLNEYEYHYSDEENSYHISIPKDLSDDYYLDYVTTCHKEEVPEWFLELYKQTTEKIDRIQRLRSIV